ncbi:MAG: hypothetical protein ACP5JG_00485 [Anaerolineae bacterium]
MSETVCITATNTSYNEDTETVAESPWSVPTMVLRTQESSSDFPEHVRRQSFYDIPEDVDVRSWLNATRRVRDFWDNDEDAVYDNY